MMRTFMPLHLLALFFRMSRSFFFEGCYFESEASFGLCLLSEKNIFFSFVFPLEHVQKGRHVPVASRCRRGKHAPDSL